MPSSLFKTGQSVSLGELSDVQGFQLFGEEKGVCISQED
jgi:hypothetical protein